MAALADTGAGPTLQACLDEVARLLDADSWATVVDGQVSGSRAGGDPELLRHLHDRCVASQSASVAAHEHLPDALRPADGTSSDGLCGMLAIHVRARRLGNRLAGFYFFRPEESMEIAWAGNPEKPVEVTAGAVKLSPRHSFDKWVEVRSGFSRPWDALAMFTAAHLQRRLEAIL
jgi:light-regulated signal transduction histidine kinase (bacteriophytochrome)